MVAPTGEETRKSGTAPCNKSLFALTKTDKTTIVRGNGVGDKLEEQASVVMFYKASSGAYLMDCLRKFWRRFETIKSERIEERIAAVDRCY